MVTPANVKKKAPTHVLLRTADRGNGSMAYTTGDLPAAWWSLRTPPVLPDGDLTFVDQPYKGSKSLRAAKKPPAVLPLGDYVMQLVVDASLARKLGKLENVVRRPTRVRDAKGIFAEGYTLFDVTARAPLDRAASRATWSRGWLETLDSAAWTDERLADVPMFRLLEWPSLLFVERGLAETIAAAANGAVSLDDYTELDVKERFPPRWSLKAIAPIAGPKGAEEAFWSLHGGDRSARTRALAVSHPWWAYAVAACMDHEPATDTRRGASGASVVASLYAAEIDRASTPITHKAARRSGLAALHYAEHIELAIDPKLRPKILADAGHDAASLMRHEAELASLARWVRGEAADGVVIAVVAAPRKWPKHAVPRYAEAQKPDSPERKASDKTRAKHTKVKPAVRSDIDAFVPRGYVRLGVEAVAAPERVVEELQKYIARVQDHKVTIAPKQRTTAQMELGCAWGEQLHRALGWQWAQVTTPAGGGLALISPDRAHAHYPFAYVGALIARGAHHNAILLLFNMLAAGNMPKAPKSSYTPLA